MEKFLKQILNKLDSLDADVKELKQLKPKIEESHLWLEALYTADRFHKADIDRPTYSFLPYRANCSRRCYYARRLFS